MSMKYAGVTYQIFIDMFSKHMRQLSVSCRRKSFVNIQSDIIDYQ